MQWFEYLIILAAVAIVASPIVITVIAKKKGKASPYSHCAECSRHSTGCCSCHKSPEDLSKHIQEK